MHRMVDILFMSFNMNKMQKPTKRFGLNSVIVLTAMELSSNLSSPQSGEAWWSGGVSEKKGAVAIKLGKSGAAAGRSGRGTQRRHPQPGDESADGTDEVETAA